MDQAIPILPSRDIQRALGFYARLGFEGEIVAPDASYGILTRGTLEVHLFLHRELDPKTSHAGCYLRVEDVRAVHQAFAGAMLPARGIPRLEAPTDRPWGMREFALVDEDGNLVRVGQVL